MRKLYASLLLIFLGAIHFCSFGQHRPIFSGYMMNPVLVNPAFTGGEGALSTALVSRVQWLGVEGGPVTNTLIAHTPLRIRSLGAGTIISYDRFGPLSTFDATLMGSYKFKIDRFRITLAGQAAYANTQFNAMSNNEQSISAAQADPVFQNISTTYYRVGLGFNVAYRFYYFGMSMPYITVAANNPYEQNNVFFNQQNIYGGLNYKITEDIAIKPSVLVKNIKGAGLQADLNLLFTIFDRFTPGISYRVNNAIVGLIMVNATRQLSFGYSYDYLTTPLTNYSSGNHEIQLRYTFKYYVNDMNVRKFK
mgnify:CR=1 FL=1